MKNPTSYRWEIFRILLEKNKKILDVELWGISQALKIALKKISSQKTDQITVYSDMQLVIR